MTYLFKTLLRQSTSTTDSISGTVAFGTSTISNGYRASLLNSTTGSIIMSSGSLTIIGAPGAVTRSVRSTTGFLIKDKIDLTMEITSFPGNIVVSNWWGLVDSSGDDHILAWNKNGSDIVLNNRRGGVGDSSAGFSTSTDTLHTYRFIIDQNDIQLYEDGVLKASNSDKIPSSTSTLFFGLEVDSASLPSAGGTLSCDSWTLKTFENISRFSRNNKFS